MTVPGHIAGAYLSLELANALSSSHHLLMSATIVAVIVGGVFPDADVFFYKQLKDHHNSPLHTPLFWVMVLPLFYLLATFAGDGKIALAFAIGVASHLFSDWFAGRAAGIRLFYPFSKKRYSLFPLQPARATVSTQAAYSKEYFAFYAENRFLFVTEAFMVIAAIGLAIYRLL